MNNAAATNEVVDITLAEFESFKQTNDLVLIDFWAEWCGPCRTMGPIIDKLAPDFENVKFVRVNVDEVPEVAELFEVRSIPTFYMVKFSGDGSFDIQKNAIGKMIGAISAFEFKQALDKLVEKSTQK